MNFPGRKPMRSLDQRNLTPKNSFYWLMHFYFIKKNEHGPTKKAWTIYIGPCFLFQGQTDKRKKTYKR